LRKTREGDVCEYEIKIEDPINSYKKSQQKKRKRDKPRMISDEDILEKIMARLNKDQKNNKLPGINQK